jgi:transposase
VAHKFTRRELLAIARVDPEALVDIILALQDQLEKLEQRVKELEARLDQNSSNSAKPPSSDGLAKPAPRSLRKKRGKKRGGQKGHSGRTLQPVEKPARLQLHFPDACPNCENADLSRQSAIDYEARQVFELPRLSLEVTEHRAAILWSPCCGELVRAPFPEGVAAPVQYGARFQSLMVYLNQQQLLPFKRLTQLCEDLFGQPLSEGTAVAAQQLAFERLEPFERVLVDQLPQSPVVHLDESGLRVEGKLHWLHVASTVDLTFYGVHCKRGAQAMDALGIVGACRGWVVHDHWKPYFTYKECLHALCNQHLLRELQGLWEQDREPWSRQLSELLLEFRGAREKKGALNQRQFKKALKRYRTVLGRGRRLHPRRKRGQGRSAQSKAANLLDRLQDFDLCVLAFLFDERVPFTNNQAEQDIRMIKVKQKISGCFRTFKGARIFCRIRSYISTCRKRGVNIWDALHMALTGKPFIPSAPPLAP